MGSGDTSPRDARSPRLAARAAATTTMDTSAVSSSSFSGAASALSPSRGLKRTREVDALDEKPAPVSASIALASRSDEPLAKRPNASPDGSSSHGGSPGPGDALRISNELLRGDIALLQQQLAAAQSEKAALDAQLAQQQQHVRNLEEDLTRIYRRQKREAESRQTAHAQTVESLQTQLERLTKQLEDRPVLDPTVALLTPETTQEMDAFVAMCTQWQQKLTALSAQLARQVARVEAAEVKAVVDGMAHRVDDAHRLSAVQTAEKGVEIQREVLRQQEQELAALAERMKAEREDTEAFESMERVVLEQRVAELEKNVNSAKEHERELLQQMANLREELATTRSGKRLIEESAWQQKLEEEAHMKDQLNALTVRCEAQQVQLTLLREDLSSLQAENDELAADLTARKQAATGEDDTASIVTKQLEDRITELKDQLAETKKKARDTEAELRADLSAKMRDEAENLNNRIEVLTMNVDAKAKVIDKLSAEKNDLVACMAQKDQALEAMQADSALLQQQVDVKNHKIETLEYEISELELNLEAKLKQAVDDASADKLELQKQMTAKTCDWVELNRELKEVKRQLESKTLELQTVATERDAVKSKNADLRGQADKWQQTQSDVAELEAKNKELVREQELRRTGEAHVQEELASVKREKQHLQDEVSALRAQVASSTAGDESKPVIQQLQNGNVSLSPEIQARIAKLLVEKRAVENFLQRYFEVAEAKCQLLTAQVVQLEAKQASHRQHAQDSCQLLRMCTQIDACDSTVRASLLDVMTTLESIS